MININLEAEKLRQKTTCHLRYPACIFHSTSLRVIYPWMFVSVFYWKSGSDAGWSETLCSDKSGCDSIVQPKRREIDWWEIIQFTGRSVWENSKERKRKSVGLRHSGRCHGSSHGVSHTHTVFIMYAVQAHTITHITMPQSQCEQSNSSGYREAYCYFRLP